MPASVIDILIHTLPSASVTCLIITLPDALSNPKNLHLSTSAANCLSFIST